MEVGLGRKMIASWKRWQWFVTFGAVQQRKLQPYKMHWQCLTRSDMGRVQPLPDPNNNSSRLSQSPLPNLIKSSDVGPGGVRHFRLYTWFYTWGVPLIKKPLVHNLTLFQTEFCIGSYEDDVWPLSYNKFIWSTSYSISRTFTSNIFLRCASFDCYAWWPQWKEIFSLWKKAQIYHYGSLLLCLL